MRTKILLACVCCMLFALLLQLFFFQRSSSRILTNQTREITQNTLENLQEDFSEYFKGIENSLIKVYNEKQFMRDLFFVREPTALKSKYGQIAYDMALANFEPAQGVDALYLYTMDHQLISSYRHANTPTYTYPEDIYSQQMENNAQRVKDYVASDNRVMLVSSCFNDKRQAELLRFVLKVYRNTVHPVGYLVCDVDTKKFLDKMDKYRYSPEQVLWVQPFGDRVALQAGACSAAQAQTFQEMSDAVKSNTWRPETASGSGKDELFQVKQKKYNFTAYCLMPQSVLRQNQQALTQGMALVLAVIAVSFFLLALLISKGLTRPLAYILNTMNRIRGGDTALRLAPMGRDEFGVLGREFNAMLDQTQRLIAQEYQASLLVKDARYKALQTQVNPHFLYNTLDTMGGIAAARSCPQVSQMCRALSNLFRYSLNMEDTLSTLQEEILAFKNYMYIINVRTDNRVRVEIDVDPALLQEQLPRMSIQPLAENALKHGLKDKHGDRLLRLSARAQGADLYVTVADNGVGMEAACVNERLQHSLEEVLRKKASIGLDNINARVRLLFGKSYGVHVESEAGKGSRVTVHLPRRKGDEGIGKKPAESPGRG